MASPKNSRSFSLPSGGSITRSPNTTPQPGRYALRSADTSLTADRTEGLTAAAADLEIERISSLIRAENVRSKDIDLAKIRTENEISIEELKQAEISRSIAGEKVLGRAQDLIKEIAITEQKTQQARTAQNGALMAEVGRKASEYELAAATLNLEIAAEKLTTDLGLAAVKLHESQQKLKTETEIITARFGSAPRPLASLK